MKDSKSLLIVIYLENMQHIAFLLLGSNESDRWAQLALARAAIAWRAGVILRASAIYTTTPWGVEGQADYLNQVLQIKTSLPPTLLLACLLDIERAMGRKRPEKWASRCIDIDLLYYDQLHISAEGLQLPHPRIAERRFVLVPMVELAPDWPHPVLGYTQRQLLEKCTDQGSVEKYEYGCAG